MIKILFVQEKNIFSLEVAIQLALLKEQGFEAKIFFNDILKEDFLPTIISENPDMVGSFTDTFDLFNDNLAKNLLLLKEIKKACPSITTFMGGIHSTIDLGMTLTHQQVDIAFVGDLETSLPQIAKTEPCTPGKWQHIPGVAFLKDGQVTTTECAPLTDLSTLPFPDIDAYSPTPRAFRHGYRIAFSRGCPNRCSFCFNHKYAENTLSKTTVTPRYYSTDYLISIMKHLKERDGVDLFYLTYGTFTHSKDFVMDFCPKYKEEVGVPYVCATRLDRVDDEIAKTLKETGCSKVTVAIESGDEYLRNKILNKNLTDKQIFEGMRHLKNHDLRVGCTIAMAFPEETLDNAFASLDMAVKMRSDFIAISIFKPIPGLDLTTYSRDKNLIGDQQTVDDFVWEKSTLNIANKHQFENLSYLSQAYLRFPYKWLFRQIIKVPQNRIFFYIRMLPRILATMKYDMRNKSVFAKARYFAIASYRTIIRRDRPELVI